MGEVNCGRNLFCDILTAESGGEIECVPQKGEEMKRIIELIWMAAWIGYFIFLGEWIGYFIFLADRYKRGSNRELNIKIDTLQGVFWITTAMLSWSDALKYRIFYLVMAALSFAVVAYRIVRGKNGIKKGK